MTDLKRTKKMLIIRNLLEEEDDDEAVCEMYVLVTTASD